MESNLICLLKKQTVTSWNHNDVFHCLLITLLQASYYFGPITSMHLIIKTKLFLWKPIIL